MLPYEDIKDFKKRFLFVAASESNNYIITVADRKLFTFGSALKEKRRNADRYNLKKYKIVKPGEKISIHYTDFEIVPDINTSHVSCGPNHSILIDDSKRKEMNTDGHPYAWGDNSHYRFGKLRKVNDEDETEFLEESQEDKEK